MKWSLALLASALGAGGLSSCASLQTFAEQQESRSAYADFLIARVANLNADHEAAADRYFLALRDEPGSVELLRGAVNASLSAGDARRARQAARMAQAASADIAAARLVRASDAVREGRWAAARAELENLDGDGIEDFAARVMNIWITAGEGNETEAVAAINAIDAPRPFSGLLDYQRALTLDMAGEREAAAAAYADARRAQVSLPPAAAREIDLLTRLGRADEARNLYRDSYGRVRDPDIARAADAAAAGRTANLPRLNPARGAAMSLYGVADFLVDQREPSRALPLITLALILDPDLSIARILQAEAFSDLERPAAARVALSQVPDYSPYAEIARAQTAWSLKRDGRLDEALARARADSERGGRLARTTLGDLYRSSGRWPEAEETYSTIIQSIANPQPGDWSLFFSRAAARDRLGDWAGAEADLRRAMQLAPDQPETLNYLGYSLIDRGERLEEGLTLIQRAIALRPNSGAIIDSLGWAYYRLGRYAEALPQLERAVQLEPADATLNDHLGDVLWRMGRRTEARFQWQRALSLDPGEERAAIEKKLAEGLPDEAPEASAEQR